MLFRSLLSCSYSFVQAVFGMFFEVASTTFIAVIFSAVFYLLFGTIFKVEGGTKIEISGFSVCCSL